MACATQAAAAGPRTLRPLLPERLRPRQLGEIIGQDELIGPQGVLSRLIEAGALPSLLLWGPPGCGKTTLARLIAERIGLRFAPFSAVLGGLDDLRALIAEAEAALHPEPASEDLFAEPVAVSTAPAAQGTLLFIDELHRFSKAQQDALLPHVEAGTVLLVGATTENPSVSVNRALLSRCRVFALAALDAVALSTLIDRALSHAEGLPGRALDADARELLIRLAAGDGRRLLVLLDAAAALALTPTIPIAAISRAGQRSGSDHDRAGDRHYDVASAFIKSMRASDVQAAIYYLARQLDSGEDPRFVARRLMIFAAEDVGLADPQALVVAAAAHHAATHLGMPEAIYPLTEATIYNATAPKSNATKAYFAAVEAIRAHPGAEVPLMLRNARNEAATAAGYGSGYVYDHDAPDHFAGQACLPDELRDAVFYVPGEFGHEREIAKRLAWWQRQREAKRAAGVEPAGS